jgi:nicotinic acid mononucleotide adenylyltransferase
VVNRGGFDKHLSTIKLALEDNKAALFVETKYMDLSSTEMRKVKRSAFVLCLLVKGNKK